MFFDITVLDVVLNQVFEVGDVFDGDFGVHSFSGHFKSFFVNQSFEFISSFLDLGLVSQLAFDLFGCVIHLFQHVLELKLLILESYDDLLGDWVRRHILDGVVQTDAQVVGKF